jgi:transcriptional regulator with XRE-family HTH domain
MARAKPQDSGYGIGARLRALREAKGYTVTELAAAVGITEGGVRQIESGQIKVPSLLIGLRLAEELMVDPYYLAYGERSSIAARLGNVENRVSVLERDHQDRARRH